VIPSFFAISVIVKPVILLKVSAKILKNINVSLKILYRCYVIIQKKSRKNVFSPINFIDIMYFLRYNIYR
jgi:hypothetical protein